MAENEPSAASETNVPQIEDDLTSPLKKPKPESELIGKPCCALTPVPNKATLSRSPSGTSAMMAEDAERVSARKQRQEAQEQKRNKEKLEQKAAEEKAREATALKAAHKRKQEEEKKEAKREAERVKKLNRDKKGSTKLVSSSSGNKDVKIDLKKELKDGLKKCEKNIEKLEKELAQLIKSEQTDLKSLETLSITNENGYISQISNEKKNKKLRFKLFQFLGSVFKPYPITHTIAKLGDSGVADWATGELLRIHDTCISFHKVLGLTPFSLAELACSLRQTDQPSVLVTNVGMALLKALLSPVRKGLPSSNPASTRKACNVKLLDQPVSIEDVDQTEEKMEDILDGLLPSPPPMEACTSLTWQDVLLHVLIRSPAADSFLGKADISSSTKSRSLVGDYESRGVALKLALTALNKNEFHSLVFEYKLVLLGCVSIQALLSGKISEEMSERFEQRLELEKRRKEEDLEENRKKKDEKSALREEAISLLKEERKGLMLKEEKAHQEGSQTSMDSFVDSSMNTSPSNNVENKKGMKKTGSSQGHVKEYHPPSALIATKVRELEEMKQIGCYRVIKQVDPNKKHQLKEIKNEILEASKEVEKYTVEEEENVLLNGDLKLSRTQLLQHRKDRDSEKVKAQKKLLKVENKLNEIEYRTEVVLKIDEMLKLASSSLTSKKINALLKEAREVELEGEDEDGEMFCVPQIKELRKKLYEIKLLEAKTRKDNYWIGQFDQLSIRKEPLGLLTAYSADNEATSDPMKQSTISFWCFGHENHSKSSKSSHKKNNEEIPTLWIKTHSSISSPISTALIKQDSMVERLEAGADPLLLLPNGSNDINELFESRWTCINRLDVLKFFYQELNQCIQRANSSDDQLNSLKNALLIQYYDELNLGNDEDEENQKEEQEQEATEWKLDHELVGSRVKRQYTVNRKILTNCGFINGWLPADENEGLALWHVKHDDYDSEDLEEEEVIEALRKWEESEEKTLYDSKQQDGSNDKNSIEGSTTSWMQYVNKAQPPKDRIGENDLGLQAFTQKLYAFEEGCFEFIKEKEKSASSSLETTSSWSKGRNNVGVARAAWRLSLENVVSVSEAKHVMLTFEDFLRSFQVVEDIDDDGLRFKMMSKEGWLFGINMSIDGKPDVNAKGPSEQPHEFVGKCVRQFYHGVKSDGKIVAYLPPDEENQALWHMVHVDGDEEDLEEDEVVKAMALYDQNVEKDDDEDEDEDEEEEGGGEEEEEDVNSNEDEESEEFDSEEEEEEDESKRTLWATLGAREKWRNAVTKSQTSSQIGLAMLLLQEAADKFGIWNVVHSKEVKNLGGSSSSRRSSGGSLLKQLTGGYGGRAAAQAARAKISKSACEEQSIFGHEEKSFNRKRQHGSSSSPSKSKRNRAYGDQQNVNNKRRDKKQSNSSKKRRR